MCPFEIQNQTETKRRDNRRNITVPKRKEKMNIGRTGVEAKTKKAMTRRGRRRMKRRNKRKQEKKLMPCTARCRR